MSGMFATARVIFLLLTALLLSEIGRAATPAPESDSGADDPALRRAQVYVHLMRAQIASSQERGGVMVRELREAVALEPDSALLHAEAARLLLRSGQPQEARRMAQRAVELDPDEPVAIRVLADLAAGRASGRSGDAVSRRTAIDLYERLARDRDVDPEVLLILAQLRLSSGDRDEAVSVARRLLSRRPGDGVALRLLVQALMLDGRRVEALQATLDFLVRNPSAEDVLLMTEELAGQTGEWERVELAAAKIIADHPDLLGPRRLRAQALLFLERPIDAVPDLEAALRLDGEDPAVRLQLARIYWRTGRFTDAATLAGELVEEFPAATQARWIVGEALSQQGDVEGALRAFASALDILRRNAPSGEGVTERDRLRLRMADLLLDHERPSEALDSLSDLEAPERVEARELEALAAIRLGDLDRAGRIVAELHGRGEPAALLLDAEVRLVRGDTAGALRRLREAIEALGDRARFRADGILQERGYSAEAEVLLREWVAAAPDDANARFALGAHLDREGRFAESEREFREAMRLDPEHDITLNHLGYSMADRNVRLDEAVELIQRAVDLDPWNPAYLDSLGWVYYRLGRVLEAREPLERAAREFPRDPTVLDHLGDLYESLGDHEGAVEAWQQALDSDPDDPDAIRAKLEGARARLSEARKGDRQDEAAPGIEPAPPRR